MTEHYRAWGFCSAIFEFNFVRIKLDCKEGWWGIICPKSLTAAGLGGVTRKSSSAAPQMAKA